jgi:putative ABC transport system permease protein
MMPMETLRTLFLRVRNLFHREHLDSELNDELATHLAMHVDDNISAGMAPEEARRDALLKLGGIEQAKESFRDHRGLPFLETLLQDVRFGLRTLRRAPGFAAIAILTLALGIGSTTAIFSVVYGVLLRPLSYPKPDQIVRLWEVNSAGGRMSFADPNFIDVRSELRSMQGLVEYSASLQSVTGGSEPTRTMIATVSRDFDSVMGVRPFIGRGFVGEDERAGAAPVALVSYGYWKEYLGASADLSAAHLKIGDKSFAVVGVFPAGFGFPDSADIWLPRELFPFLISRSAHNWQVAGRLNDGQTLDSTRSELSAIASQLQRQHGSEVQLVAVAAEPLREAMTGHVRTGLILLLLASGFLLAIACANVVNLMLAQAGTREREVAVRLALGAGRARLMRQFLTEALLLAVSGCALGVMAAAWGVKALVQIAPTTLPRLEDVSINYVVLLFSLGMTLLLAAGLGIFSALRASANAGDAIHEATKRQEGSVGRHLLGRLLVAGQIAVTLALLAGAGLLGRSLLQVLSVNPGFQTARVITMDLALPGVSQNTAKAPRVQFLSELMTRLRQIPGVEEVGGSSALPLADGFSSDGSYATLNPQQLSPQRQDLIRRSSEEGLDSDPELLKDAIDFFNEIFSNQANTGEADYAVASEGYFTALRIPLVRGRLFDDRDGFDAPQVALVSDSLAKERWPRGDALGHTIEFGNIDGDLRLLTIVGVVGDVRETSVEDQPRPTIYVNYRQRPQATRQFTVVLRSNSDVQSVMVAARATLRDLDTSVPPKFSTLPQIYSAALETRRFSLTLVGIFAGMALLLASAGIYGLTAYSVARRTREFGIRMALGATPGNVLRKVFGNGVATTLAGIAAGIGGAFALTKAMQSLLFGVTPADSATFVGVVLLLTLVSLLACYIPARRATRVDPMIALRYE